MIKALFALGLAMSATSFASELSEGLNSLNGACSACEDQMAENRQISKYEISVFLKQKDGSLVPLKGKKAAVLEERVGVEGLAPRKLHEGRESDANGKAVVQFTKNKRHNTNRALCVKMTDRYYCKSLVPGDGAVFDGCNEKKSEYQGIFPIGHASTKLVDCKPGDKQDKFSCEFSGEGASRTATCTER